MEPERYLRDSATMPPGSHSEVYFAHSVGYCCFLPQTPIHASCSRSHVAACQCSKRCPIRYQNTTAGIAAVTLRRDSPFHCEGSLRFLPLGCLLLSLQFCAAPLPIASFPSPILPPLACSSSFAGAPLPVVVYPLLPAPAFPLGLLHCFFTVAYAAYVACL